ncbi:MAG: DUF2569 domain-containing protein, partial [Bacteroidota bacterium]
GSEESIGGWMVLPAIGLVLTPVLLIVDLVRDGYLTPYIWSAFSTYENSLWLTLATVFELGCNVLFLVFSVLLIILFSKKRTSLPLLMVVFYSLNVVVPILDTFLINALLPEELIDYAEDEIIYRDIVKSIIGAGIWIPYFLVSRRVKNTFVRQYARSIEATRPLQNG